MAFASRINNITYSVQAEYSDFPEEYRDRPLGFHWHAPDLARLAGLPPAANTAAERVRNSILAEAALGTETDQAVSYSRNREFYRRAGRYRHTHFTYRLVLSAVAELAHADLIVDNRVRPGNLGWQSSFYATAKLMDIWRGTDQRLTYDQGEIIWLRNEAKELIDYRDTEETRRLRRQLQALNETLASLGIAIPGVQYRGRYLHLDDACVLPIPGNPLRRIFSRSSWSLHGRAYGWWQNIPKTFRNSLTINGEPVVEVDYTALHPTILYNQADISFAGDPYVTAGFERNEVKLGFNISVNARCKPDAVAALAANLKKDRNHCIRVIDAIQHRHKPIAGAFCSDAGVRLMRKDSDLILTRRHPRASHP